MKSAVIVTMTFMMIKMHKEDLWYSSPGGEKEYVRA